MAQILPELTGKATGWTNPVPRFAANAVSGRSPGVTVLAVGKADAGHRHHDGNRGTRSIQG
ncbi:MAG: hypothetical protein KDI74_13195 [Gammaproteobacteria bacterium]|nr:hypothetical protein [Gammaproteobacteria bacterium]HXK57638.1 hypothetical protein [Gammaproteobacteria bacterium]